MKGVLNRLILLLIIFLPLPLFASTPEEATECDTLVLSKPILLPPDSLIFLRDSLQTAAPFEIKDTAIADSVADTDRNWWHLFKQGKLSLQDTTVEYPRFMKFCVDVYNWADKFFNSYDPEYVLGTGKRWKARLVNDNWTDSYALHFKKNRFNIRMLSDFNVNLGAYLHYMAVSVGYSVDMKTVFGGKKTDHSRFDFNFSCALFSADISYYKSDGSNIRQFTGYNLNRIVKEDFPGLKMTDFNASIYYFFNNKRYSQGAAYNFSKYQIKSAGSWIVGFTYNNLDLDMDFSTLPDKMKPQYTFENDHLKFHYYSYCVMFGYGFNWVLHPKWLFNITAVPSIGFNHCYEDASDGSGNQLALNVHGRSSLTFNHRQFFTSVIGKITGNWYTSKNLSLFNAIEYFSINVGFRF